MEILKNTGLKPFNTFGVEAKTKQLGILSSVQDFKDALPEIHSSERSLILGSGSNVLFSKDFDGLVLVNRIGGKQVVAETDTDIVLKVSGGEDWSELVDYSVAKGWGGLENLSLIPGTVGAAPVQNIGAYGVELKEVLVALEAIEIETGETQQFSNLDCEFGYRYSIFKGELKGLYFITDVLLKLSKNPDLNLKYAPLKNAFARRKEQNITVAEVGEAVKTIRRSKLPNPLQLGNAGSFFKNPVVTFSKIEELNAKYPDTPFYKVNEKDYKLAAGWLIEKSGWKGKRIGDAGVHEKQALVLVNYGNASGKDILNLSTKVRGSVNSQFGIELESEVTII